MKEQKVQNTQPNSSRLYYTMSAEGWFRFFCAVVLVLASTANCRGIFRCSDDTDPALVVVQNLASKLDHVEAELTAQKEKVASLEAQLQNKVAFSAEIAGGTDVVVGDHQAIPFNKVTLNIGSGYNQNTLTFTAPHAGLYWFYVRLDETGFRSIAVHRNGTPINRCDNDRLQDRSITCAAVVNLTAGDTITVNHLDLDISGGHVDAGPESFFLGFLLR